MALHRLSSFTFEVPDPDAVVAYYVEFGLTDNGDGSMSTTDGGRQLHVRQGNRRRISELVVGADDEDDLGRVAASLAAQGFGVQTYEGAVRSIEPVTGTVVSVVVEPLAEQPARTPPGYNGPGEVVRTNSRADGASSVERVTPRRLGHVVLGTTDAETTQRFFVEGVGFKVSDRAGVGAFLRCSTDHHNLLVMGSPAVYPHHTSWQVDDVDQIGRGAMDMLEGHPERHVWGLGRHYAGSNFFWYLKDPAGTFSEYYSDMDCIVDDSLWSPESVEGARGLFRWGPPPPASFLDPEDIAAHIVGAHAR
ncbi:VOC family protein [Longivirga aurantiaca]|uniref:VOC family protein n=1 Tax=Longivirga aurantiaca TaxID=1837743 RepID=A0ABW1SZW9_9ACTN